MEIIAKRCYITPSGMRFDTGIQTKFDPAEIIAIRPDGTSESTNPEALRLRELDKQRQIAAAMNVVSDQVSADFMVIVANRDAEIKRLESELKAANDELQTYANTDVSQARRERDEAKGYLAQMQARIQQYEKAANHDFELLKEARAERDQLKRQLGESDETIKSQRARLVQLQAKAELEKMKACNLENCNTAMEFSRLNGLKNVEIERAKAELQRRAKIMEDQVNELNRRPIFDMAAQTLWGMSLDEVRGLKVERDVLKSELTNSEITKNSLQQNMEQVRLILGATGGVTQAAEALKQKLKRAEHTIAHVKLTVS